MKPASTFVAILGLAAMGAHALVHYQRPHAHRLDRSLEAAAPIAKNRLFHADKLTALTTAATAEDANTVFGGAYLATHNITSVTGRFKVPQATQPTAGPTADTPLTYAASFWVGIDGVACRTGTLRAGVDVFWSMEGEGYHAWYQVEAGASKDFLEGEVDVSPGDEVLITAGPATSNGAAAVVVFTNRSTNQTATRALPANETLCRTEAAWMVEDFVLVDQIGFPAPLANFTHVTFAGMAAQRKSRDSADEEPADLRNAEVLKLVQQEQGGQIVDCSTVANGRMTCKRSLIESASKS